MELPRARSRLGHVVTEGSVPVPCSHGQQAQLLLRPAHKEGVPLRGFAMADIQKTGRASLTVRQWRGIDNITVPDKIIGPINNRTNVIASSC